MKVSPFRLVELLLTIIACVIVGNALMSAFTGSADQMGALGPNKSLAEVLSGAWLLALIFAPKQLPRI